MSNTTTNLSESPLRGFFARFAAGLERAMERSARVRSRRAQIEALEAKSDAELAQLGIARDQIAYHVFKDLFYA
ncbi:uncharacterized protein YjiS (DUF1127 family) [Roseovarius sp. MBR-78]|uniref:hypothetical protein n=1 Tax=Roseovarius sp. MBR-78 TaxID=3156460 RepID=UPI003398E9EB